LLTGHQAPLFSQLKLLAGKVPQRVSDGLETSRAEPLARWLIRRGWSVARCYAATKAALEAHTLNLAAELADTGVSANIYRPGAVDTAMQTWICDQSPDEIGGQLHERFVSTHETGQLLTALDSATSLLKRLPSEASGQIWSVAD
jgi:NAD(P)-dependent dehydrogenase (short-subunit alcohol dehydrogenase family)